MNEYELIDRTDNDCHDTGTREEMLREAAIRNAAENTRQWVAKPAGYSDANYKG